MTPLPSTTARNKCRRRILPAENLLFAGVCLAVVLRSSSLVDSFGIHHSHPASSHSSSTANHKALLPQHEQLQREFHDTILSPSSSQRRRRIHRRYSTNDNALDDTDQTDEDDDDLLMDYDDEDNDFDVKTLNKLTVPQLKQQLRLRGLKISGTKQELINRLSEKQSESINARVASVLDGEEAPSSKTKETKAQKVAREQGKEFIDVEAYLDEDDKGKDVKTSLPLDENKRTKEAEENAPLSNPEVWGSDARIVEDYEGRSPVVDGLSRTVVAYTGSNQTDIQAYVVASRDAMKPFLEGGKNRTITNSDPLKRLQEIQSKREQAEKRPVRMGDDQGLDEGDPDGIYKSALHRDFSDWGEFSATGAQLSAEEVQGVLILSDVYGPFTEATKNLAEKIAFECQPVVCMAPDLFRGNPWREDPTTPGFNEEGQDYETWRASHPDLRISVDIRASAEILRQQYGVSSVVVWGTCFGGGRALEIAAGYLPNNQIHDVDGTIGPVPVRPEVVVAWYPTRYNANLLFGPKRSDNLKICEEPGREFAIMGVFAGKDALEGATPKDAEALKSLLESDDRIKDHMIKVFPDQEHGFAHNIYGRDKDESELDRFVNDEFGGAGRVTVNDGDADVACLLSTAFMETYSRKFLPTTGSPVAKDEAEFEWNAQLNMKDLSVESVRDVKAEIHENLRDHQDLPLEGRYIDPGDESKQDELFEALRAMQDPDASPEFKINEGDNIETAYAKLIAGDQDFSIF
jgi:dienelactone hydrolase